MSRETELAALCVLVKTKEPQIEWHQARRTGEQMTEFLAKAGSWCDYLRVCTGDQTKISQTLIQISPGPG